MSYLFFKRDGVVQFEQTLENLVTLYQEAKGQHRSTPVAIIDVDNTLRCNNHRIDLLPSPEVLASHAPYINDAYLEFNEYCHKDTAIAPVIALLEALDQEYFIVLLTSCQGTQANFRTLKEQCDQWGVMYGAIIMRGDDCHLPSPEMKQEVSLALGWNNNSGNIAIDDDEKVCAMFHDLGITTFRVYKSGVKSCQ